jgi:homoserine O-acetyltransferase
VENKNFKYNDTITLESGELLHGFQLNYSTLGKLNADKSNVIWVCHALTANSDVVSWWDGMIGDGALFDPSKHFIICANILASCYGSTGPLDINPQTHKQYFLDFPQITIRDMVQALNILREDLGITKIQTLIGGSLGGQQAMEWAIIHPNLIENLVLLATNAQHSPWGIAFNESQRLAIMADPTWKDEHAEAGRAGLKAARAAALLSYRNYEAYWRTQSDTDIEKTDHYKAQSYQQYQGDKLVSRFNVHSYWYLTKAMDSHHVGRSRGGVENALAQIKAKTLVIGIISDILFPVEEQKRLAELIPNGVYVEIDSFYGHDGFLIETKEIVSIINDFYHSSIKAHA